MNQWLPTDTGTDRQRDSKNIYKLFGNTYLRVRENPDLVGRRLASWQLDHPHLRCVSIMFAHRMKSLAFAGGIMGPKRVSPTTIIHYLVGMIGFTVKIGSRTKHNI